MFNVYKATEKVSKKSLQCRLCKKEIYAGTPYDDVEKFGPEHKDCPINCWSVRCRTGGGTESLILVMAPDIKAAIEEVERQRQLSLKQDCLVTIEFTIIGVSFAGCMTR